MPSSSGCASSTGEWSHCRPCRGSWKESKQGELAAIGWTAEQTSFGRDSLNTMLALAEQGIGRLVALQRRAVDARGEVSFVL